MKKIIITFVFILLFVSPAFGITKYGDATIVKGYLTVVRGGRNLQFSDSGQSYVILNKDVLKVGDDSLVILRTVQDSIVRMGSNAVFQVRPWKQKKRRGYLRMLYGKAIFKVSKFFTKRARFTLKTATAVAGVRGTEWKQSTTSTGVTEVEVIKVLSVVIIEPAGTDIEVPVNPGERLLALNTVRITRPFKVPVGERVEERDPEFLLVSVNPENPQAVVPENRQFYIDNNLLTPDELDQGQRENVSIDEDIEEPEAEEEAVEEEAVEEAVEEVVKEEEAEEEPDETFETNFEESQEVEEVELQAALPLVSIEVGVPEIEAVEELEDLVDTEDIIEDLTDIIEDTTVQSLEKKGNLSIEFEK